MYVLGKETIIFVHTAYGNFSIYPKETFLYTLCIDNMSIFNIDKYNFLYIWYRQFVYVSCRQKYLCLYYTETKFIYQV